MVCSSSLRSPNAARSATRLINYPKQIDASFLGRESFLRSLDRALIEAASGSLCTVLLTGEAGAGKTTALIRAATIASDMGFRVKFYPLRRNGRGAGSLAMDSNSSSLAEGERESWLTETLQGGAEAVAWVLPELQDLVPQSMRSPTSDSRFSRFRLLESIQALIRAVSLGGPLAILIDDLHEADQASLQVLGHLAAELSKLSCPHFRDFSSPRWCLSELRNDRLDCLKTAGCTTPNHLRPIGI
jgi:predicted ATPase